MDNPFYNERFPRSNTYDHQWVAENHMGPNALWLAEWLMEALPLEPGMRVLDMGCGRALSSIFLAREYGCTVFAADLWIPAADNWNRVCEARMEDLVFPVHAEAHALPFAENFFDAVVSFDSYMYYGTDDLYLSYIQRYLRPGGRIGIVVPGLTRELDGAPPGHLLRPQANGRVFWDPDCFTFHSAQWWRRHWEKTGLVSMEIADVMPDGWRHWAQHERAVESLGTGIFPSDEEALLRDAGSTLALVRVIGCRHAAPGDEASLKGAQPHVWEPAFTSVCARLMASRRREERRTEEDPSVVPHEEKADDLRAHDADPEFSIQEFFIVPAEEGMLQEWIAMRLELWPECPREESAREIARILQSKREAAFLAMDTNGRALGFVEVSTREYVDGCTTSPVGYLEGIFVRRQARGYGIGRALVRSGQEWARTRGCTEMGSDARDTDTRSILFHQAVGFTETERQVVYLKTIE
jgi:SAM-dependent methyltransferase